MTQKEFDKLSDINKVKKCVELSLREHEGLNSQFWKGSAHMGKSVLECIKKIKTHPVILSLPSEQDILNEARLHGRRLFNMDFDSEQLDLIQSSMNYMQDIIIEMNNNEITN